MFWLRYKKNNFQLVTLIWRPLDVYILVTPCPAEKINLLLCFTNRDANHSNFCRIIPFFKADFRITNSEVKIPQNNDLEAKIVPDRIKDVTHT